jgi:hypothetical protein
MAGLAINPITSKFSQLWTFLLCPQQMKSPAFIVNVFIDILYCYVSPVKLHPLIIQSTTMADE